jgi:hypothetical protein
VPVALLSGIEPLRTRADGATAPEEAWGPVLAKLGVAEVPLPGARWSLDDSAHAPYEAGWARPDVAGLLEASAPGLEPVWPLLGDATKAAVFVGPRGAVSESMSALREMNPLTFRLRWRVDPFWLLARVFKAPGEPSFDTTTVNGRRVFYAHVDGDGFSNKAVRRGDLLAAEVLRDEVLKKTWLPTSVSVIARELVGHPDREAIARSIYRLPSVDPASHSYTHPHDWALGTVTSGGAADGATGPVAATHETLVPRHEVVDAARYIDTLAPAPKRVEALLWSGRTNPPAGFLEVASEAGIANLNGGDATLDERFPSAANLAPLGRQVGPYLQVYASAANENLFTNLWTGPFDGQAQALKLFRFSEAPRRLLPVNIYYHFYAAERLAGLKALNTLYRWAETQPLCHMRVAAYSRTVEGFYTARLNSEGPGVWSVAGAGTCRTLRFDGERRRPDMAASRAVAGWNTANGSLYVHLSGPDARVVLVDAASARPRLAEASAPLLAWASDERAIVGDFDGAAPVTVELAGFKPGQLVSVSGFSGAGRASAAGSLRLSAPAGRRHLEVRW